MITQNSATDTAPKPQTHITETQQYVELLYPDAFSEAWLVVSWITSTKQWRSQWFRIAQSKDAAAFISRQARRHNVYTGLGLRHPDCMPTPNTRGERAEVYALPGLWIEFDHNAGVHVAKHLPTPDELLTFIEGLPFRFSLLIDSGGGIHAHLLFKEVWVLDTDAERDAADLLLRRFQRTIQEQAAAHGWQVDSTADLPRVLRPTGTLNHKTSPPKPVTLLHEEAIRYNPTHLADAPWLATMEETYIPAANHGDFPPTRLEPIVAGCAWLQHCRDDAATLPEPEWYAMLGMVGRCVEGAQMAHEWSAPYPRYSKEETTQKLQHALAHGPLTCKTIRYDKAGDEYCRNCQHWGKIKSPMVLGIARTSAQDARRRRNGDTQTAADIQPAGPGPNLRGAAHAVVVTMTDVEAKPVEWLWWPYIAIGAVCMFDGDPGIGKTLCMTQIAASLTRGHPLPDQQGKPTLPTGSPQPTLLLSTEDSLAHTLKPRLESAGADCSKIHVLTGWVDEQGQERVFTLQYLPLLQQEIQRYHPRLVVIDPVTAYMGKIDIHRANEVQELMGQLTRLAERYRCAIVCIRHPAKPGQHISKVIHRGLGSVGFIGTARTALFVEEHPTNPTQVLLGQSKNNMERMGRTQLFNKAEGRFEWAGVSRLTADVMSGSGRGPDPRAFLEAVCWLEDYLTSGIPQNMKTIREDAEEAGIAFRTLQRAKQALQIRSIPKGKDLDGKKVWDWQLVSLSIISPPLGVLDVHGSLGVLGVLGVDKENQQDTKHEELLASSSIPATQSVPEMLSTPSTPRAPRAPCSGDYVEGVI